MAEPRVAVFDALLKTNNIPIHGVSGHGPGCRIDFKDEATAAQQAQAAALAASFDWQRRRNRPDAAIANDIRNLSAPQRQQLNTAVLLELAVDFLKAHPRFAENLGIAVSGDELDP